MKSSWTLSEWIVRMPPRWSRTSRRRGPLRHCSITRDVRAARARSSAVPPAEVNPFVHLHEADSLPRHANRSANFGYDALTLINDGGPDAHTYPDTQSSGGRRVRPARRQARPAAGTGAAHDVVAATGHARHGAAA